jgi:hypothetical protein
MLTDFEYAGMAAAEGLSDDHSENVRQSLRFQAQRSTYVMGKAIVGFEDLVPHVHGDMCRWIERPSRRKLGLVPRDHLKTSIWTIADTVRRIAVDCNTRMLIGNETATNSAHFLRRIQAVFERSQIFRWLFPEIIPDTAKTKWNEQEMLIPRTQDFPESTVEAMGVGGAVVSRHYTHIKLDDLVGKEASESVDVMKKTIDWYLYTESLLVRPTDPIDVYGTTWTFKDLYSWIQEHELDVDFFHRKAIDKRGRVLWPERFPLHELERIRAKIGPFKFSCQYQNEPFDPEHMTFDPGWLRYYELDGWEPDNESSSQVLRVVGQPKPSRVIPVILIDPAISEKDYAARSAVVCAGLDEMDRIFVLEAWADRCQPLRMIDKVFEMAERWDPMVVAVEGVAYQRALKGFMEAECLRRRKWLNIREVRPGSREGKETRIRGLQPYAERGRLWLRRSTCKALVEEFESFPLGETVDLLDALGYGPQVWIAPEGSSTQQFEADEDKPYRYEGISAHTGY